jgi:hypothetical protein
VIGARHNSDAHSRRAVVARVLIRWGFA